MQNKTAKCRKNHRKDITIVLIVIIFIIGIAMVWIIMQQSTNSIISDIENAVRNNTYYAVTDNGLTAEGRAFLDENQVKYEECNRNQALDNYKVRFSPTCGMTVDQYLDGYTLKNVDIHRSYSLHNFNSGYIWVVVRYSVLDKEGDLIGTQSYQGGPKVGIKFKIKRVDGQWKIIDIL